MGYLTDPHTSSGRVPSEKAYRLYVNEMMPRTELSAAAKDAIAMQLPHSNVNELENIVQRAAHVLSEITSLTAFAMTPKRDQDTLKYINLLPVDERTVVLMLASESRQGVQHIGVSGQTGLRGNTQDTGQDDDVQLPRQDAERGTDARYNQGIQIRC